MAIMQDKQIRALVNLGLTQTQAKIYLSNFQIGQATVKAISQASTIAREDVYRVLPTLERLGLVTKYLASPAMYEAVEPKSAIEILLKLKESEYLRIRGKASQALKELSKSNNSSCIFKGDEKTVLISKAESGPDKGVFEAMKTVKRTVDFTTRYNLFLHAFNDAQLEGWITKMHKATNRGVKFRMMLDKPLSKKPVSELSFDIPESNFFLRSNNLEYRYSPCLLQCILIVFDNKKCLIETSTEQDVNVKPYIWSNNPILVSLSQTYFEKAWDSAQSKK